MNDAQDRAVLVDDVEVEVLDSDHHVDMEADGESIPVNALHSH